MIQRQPGAGRLVTRALGRWLNRALLSLFLGCAGAASAVAAEIDDWQRATSLSTCKGYRAFLEQHPDGKLAPAANKCLDELGCGVAEVPANPHASLAANVSIAGGADPGSQGALEFTAAYYDALSHADVDRAKSMWERVPDRLASIIGDIEYCRINNQDVAAIDGASARLNVDVTCKNRRGRPESWKVSVVLVRPGGSWQIRSIGASGHDKYAGTRPSDRDAVDALVKGFVSASKSRDSSKLASLFADQADYYGTGQRDRAFIRSDKQRYFERWPQVIEYEPVFPPTMLFPSRGRAVVEMDIRYRVRNEPADLNASGKIHTTLTLQMKDGSAWIITIAEQRQPDK